MSPLYVIISMTITYTCGLYHVIIQIKKRHLEEQEQGLH